MTPQDALKELKKLEITEVEANFSGHDGEGEVEIDGWDSDADLPGELVDALKDLFWDCVENVGDFTDEHGAFGRIRLAVEDGSVDVQYNERFVTSHLSNHDFMLEDVIGSYEPEAPAESHARTIKDIFNG